jgi:hypothetical protein
VRLLLIRAGCSQLLVDSTVPWTSRFCRSDSKSTIHAACPYTLKPLCCLQARQKKTRSGASCIVQDVTRTYSFLLLGCLDALSPIYSCPVLHNALSGWDPEALFTLCCVLRAAALSQAY